MERMQCHNCCYVTLVERLNRKLNGLVDVATGGGEPRTFVSVSFHGFGFVFTSSYDWCTCDVVP